ncbi:predicted protein [Histoplasma mississippiense (nom. inval.)]|uniref:predicted protein n=1 Tax=Ajellomyces capsulatus (strain NAm1 / WU24) TaxID=2059318 RepID=UPI000157BB6F|nr:predicted protein [Histoplasma mississippiense (nom. inval.)]EDN05715.1 predicted protein [Histoplasma mississippiense (nom. inval.)]
MQEGFEATCQTYRNATSLSCTCGCFEVGQPVAPWNTDNVENSKIPLLGGVAQTDLAARLQVAHSVHIPLSGLRSLKQAAYNKLIGQKGFPANPSHHHSAHEAEFAQSAFRASSHPPDSPEAIILAELGDEYLHLPAIVEAAESSPAAAKAAADTISRVLSNPASKKGYKQYNAIMLIRILSDNPGTTFTRNFDGKFVSITKNLLREGRDMSVQQILRETLEFLAVQKSHDTNVAPLVEMWKKEKLKFEKAMGVSAGPWVQPLIPGQRDDYFARSHRSSGLPSPEELSARITEANISASLLLQFVQSTPTAEFYTNDLLKEFSARCQAAAKSIQGYINATNPSPDEDTMLTLIETNDRLSAAFLEIPACCGRLPEGNASRTDSQEAVSPCFATVGQHHNNSLLYQARAGLPQNFRSFKAAGLSASVPSPSPSRRQKR